MAYSWQYPGEEIRILPQKSKRINVLGLMNQDNKLISFPKEGSIQTDFVLTSLQQWVDTLLKPTVLVLDNASIHQSKCFREKLKQWQQQNLFIFFLPKYCPHMNKIEMLWRKVKYEWLQPKDYTSLPILKEALRKLFSQVGQEYRIVFNKNIL
jgi:transposase